MIFLPVLSRFLRKLAINDEGGDLVEYALIVALIGSASITGMRGFALKLASGYSQIAATATDAINTNIAGQNSGSSGQGGDQGGNGGNSGDRGGNGGPGEQGKPGPPGGAGEKGLPGSCTQCPPARLAPGY